MFIKLPLLPDNQILIAGSDKVARYHSEGSLNTSFGFTGRIFTAHLVSDMVARDDGSFIIAGTEDNDFAISTYSANGQLLFETHHDFGNPVEVWNALAMQDDGKIVTVGYGGTEDDTEIVIARYLPDLNVSTFNRNTVTDYLTIYPNPVSNRATLKYNLPQKEKITIQLFDAQGKLIQTFFEKKWRAGGEHREFLAFEEGLLPGNYILQFITSKGRVSVKVTVQ